MGKVTDRFEYTKIVSKANYVKNVFLYEWDLTIAVLTARTDTPEYMIEETQRQTQMLGGGEGRRTPACDIICPVPWTRSRVRKPAGTPSAVNVTASAHDNFRVPNPVCPRARAPMARAELAFTGQYPREPCAYARTCARSPQICIAVMGAHRRWEHRAQPQES